MGGSVDTTTTYSYTVIFPHSGLMEGEEIFLYDNTGAQLTFSPLGPNDSDVDYANGLWRVPGTETNEELAKLSTASYWIQYDNDKVKIEYGADITVAPAFYISTDLLSKDREDIVSASFKYQDKMSDIAEINNIRDGIPSTQTQVIFFAQPLPSQPFAILDFGTAKDIDAIDITAGFFKPDDTRKFDVSMWFSLKASSTAIDPAVDYTGFIDSFNFISREATNFHLSGGEAASFEIEDLGESFQTRYLMIVLENVEKINFLTGRWVVALSEIGIYQDVVLKAEAILVATAPEEGPLALHDEDAILGKIGDKLYRETNINRLLTDQTTLSRRAKDMLTEFYKEHEKGSAQLLWGGHIYPGDTLLVTDAENNISTRYFVESISSRKGGVTQLELARYPG